MLGKHMKLNTLVNTNLYKQERLWASLAMEENNKC